MICSMLTSEQIPKGTLSSSNGRVFKFLTYFTATALMYRNLSSPYIQLVLCSLSRQSRNQGPTMSNYKGTVFSLKWTLYLSSKVFISGLQISGLMGAKIPFSLRVPSSTCWTAIAQGTPTSLAIAE
jgi:hypothetical protein